MSTALLGCGSGGLEFLFLWTFAPGFAVAAVFGILLLWWAWKS